MRFPRCSRGAIASILRHSRGGSSAFWGRIILYVLYRSSSKRRLVCGFVNPVDGHRDQIRVPLRGKNRATGRRRFTVALRHFGADLTYLPVLQSKARRFDLCSTTPTPVFEKLC